MSDDFQLSDDERARLERLKRDLAPPARLEAHLIEALRRDGLIRDPRPRWATAVIVFSSLAAGLLAALFVYRLMNGTGPLSQPQFVLLLYAGDESTSGPGRREEYTDWARSIAKEGTPISGMELVETPDQIAVLPDNVPQSSSNQPRGFFIVHARDLADAKRIAATCPHLKYGGQIVLRRAAS